MYKGIHACFSGRFSRASLEWISFNFFVCFIFNVSLGSASKRKNFDIQHNTRVGLGCQFTSNRLSCHHKHFYDIFQLEFEVKTLPKALSTLIHSTYLVQSINFNNPWNLGQPSAWFWLAKGKNNIEQLWHPHFNKSMYQFWQIIHVRTENNPCINFWQIHVTT